MNTKIKEKLISAIALAVVLFSLLACGISPKSSKFDSPEELIDACADALTSGDSEALLSYMPDQMIKRLAKENNATEKEVRNAILDWYNEEFGYFSGWLDDEFDGLNNTYWYFEDKQQHKFPEDMYEEYKDVPLNFNGYIDHDIFANDPEEIIGCRLIVTAEDGYRSDSRWIEFIIEKIDGLWYFVGID